MSQSAAPEALKDLSAWPLSDLVQHEEDLESALLTNGRRIDHLLAQFQRQYLALKSERDSIEAQLVSTRRIAADKSRVALLLRFPWELSRVAHLLCPSRDVLSEPGRSSEWGDPSALLTFGSERLTKEAVAYFDALRRAKADFQGNPSLLQEKPGSCVPLAAVGLAKPLTASLLSPYPPLSAADMVQCESVLAKAMTGARLEKVNQPTLLADRAFIPYMGASSEGKRTDRQRALKSRRYCEEEWAMANPGIVQAEGDGSGTVTTQLKRSALIEFPLMKSKAAGRTLTSVRPHATGELLFVDEAIFTFPERAEDLILTKELEEALDLIQKKSDLFAKHPTWDIRLVIGVFAFLGQSSDSTPLARQGIRGAGQLSALTSRRLNEQLELRRKLFSLACPLDDIDPTQLNEWYKVGQLIQSVLPKHYQALEGGAEGADATVGHESTPSTLSIDDIVKLLLILRCNSVLNAVASSNGLGAIPHPTTRSVFWMVSMLNHSCHPNVTLTYVPDLVDQETGKVLVMVQALRPIEVGEQLFISYINPHQPAAAARRALRERYFFECQCPRCSGGSVYVPCREEEALDWTRAVDSTSEQSCVLVPRGTGGVWIKFSTDPERWGTVLESSGKPITFSTDSENGLALLQEESRWGQSTLMVQWPKQLQLIEEEGIQKDLIRTLIEEVAAEQRRLVQLRTSGQSSLLTDRMRLLRSGLMASPAGEGTPQDRKGYAPRVNHYCLVLAQLFVARCTEALLKRFLPLTSEDNARSLIQCVDEVANSMIVFCAELTVGVGLDFNSELKLKVEHSSLRNLLASNTATVASCWEQLAVLLTLLSETQVPGTKLDKPLLVAVASECWQLAYGVYQTMNWTGTSKAIRAQLYACQPQRMVEDWGPEEGSKVKSPNCTNCAEYIPPFL